jgi:hypothetical protein
MMNAALKHNKIVHVLGCTATIFDPDTGEIISEFPKRIKLMGVLTKNLTMTNSYSCVKDFNITYKNVRDLTWHLLNPINKPYPDADAHESLMIEREVVLVEK